MPCLVWDSPEGRQVFDLDRVVLILGRDEVADVQILEASVSRRHALVQIENGGARVTDLGSSSGTRINGAKLTPDMPSSVEPGDFVQLGRVTMTFHANPPPVPKVAAPKAATTLTKAPSTVVKTAGPAAARPPAAETSNDRWKMIALVLAFVVVAALGAVIALVASRDDPKPAPAEAQAETRADPPPEDGPDAQTPDTRSPNTGVPPVDPDPDPEPIDKTAPEGEMPPQEFLSPIDYPDLIEFEYSEYYPVRLVTWDGTKVEAVGGDGRTYMLPQSKVTKGENRIDLARRAARARAQLDSEDAAAYLELAQWCAKRFIRSETRVLARRVLELRPNDPEATRLLRSTE